MNRPLILVAVTCQLFATSSLRAETPGSRDLSLAVFYPGLFHAMPLPVDSTLNTGAEDEEGIKTGRVVLVGGLLAGSMVAIHVYQQNGWWADNRTEFHFQEDLDYGLWTDKIGHFYSATLFSYSIQKSLEWGNVPTETAIWWGSGGALLFQTYVEIQDGFSTWGFDRVDFAFDVLGAAWPIARYYVPSLRSFDLKLSYHPSPLLGEAGGAGFEGQKHLIFDDYEGQTFWLSVKLNDLLPEAASDVWPDFLCLAVGYGARDIAGPDPYPVILLAPDLDMTRIIPQETNFLKTLGEVLNFIHLPMPAVQISPGVIWYGIYF